jgi:hypothetical protein
MLQCALADLIVGRVDRLTKLIGLISSDGTDPVMNLIFKAILLRSTVLRGRSAQAGLSVRGRRPESPGARRQLRCVGQHRRGVLGGQVPLESRTPGHRLRFRAGAHQHRRRTVSGLREGAVHCDIRRQRHPVCVGILNDESQSILQEVVRSGRLNQVHLGLDFFDAIINRVEAEASGYYFARLQLGELLNTMTFGAVWKYYCVTHKAPVESEILGVIHDHDRAVMTIVAGGCMLAGLPKA